MLRRGATLARFEPPSTTRFARSRPDTSNARSTNFRGDLMRSTRTRRLGWTSFILSLLFSMGNATPALAQGELDTAFGGDGKVTTNFSPKRDFAYDVAIQPSDGRIVAAGLTGGLFALARFNTDGTLDTT